MGFSEDKGVSLSCLLQKPVYNCSVKFNFRLKVCMPPIACRGFEGLAVSPDGKTLMAMLQSPAGDLSDGRTNESLLIPVVKIDISDPSAPVVSPRLHFLATSEL